MKTAHEYLLLDSELIVLSHANVLVFFADAYFDVIKHVSNQLSCNYTDLVVVPFTISRMYFCSMQSKLGCWLIGDTTNKDEAKNEKQHITSRPYALSETNETNEYKAAIVWKEYPNWGSFTKCNKGAMIPSTQKQSDLLLKSILVTEPGIGSHILSFDANDGAFDTFSLATVCESIVLH